MRRSYQLATALPIATLVECSLNFRTSVQGLCAVSCHSPTPWVLLPRAGAAGKGFRSSSIQNLESEGGSGEVPAGDS